MVQINTFAVAILASVAGASAAQNCPAGFKLCGYTLNNGVYGYSIDTLKAALSKAGVTGVSDAVVLNTIYLCADGQGGITADKASVCHQCYQPWAQGQPPFEDAICQVA